MRFESLPEIPRPENPEHEWLKKEAENTVADKVAELDIGLDLQKHPELRSRLAETGSHFEDSLSMARIIRTIYDQLREPLNLRDQGPERLMRAAVLHDIGKSGPAGEEGPFHFAVRRLFVAPQRPFNPFIDGRAKTVSEFAAEQELADRGSILGAVKDAGIDPEQEPMIVFWRRHAGWTYDILKSEAGADIDPGLVDIAASHHLLENQNPAHLDMERIPAESQVLEVLEEAELLAAVDKYQAFRSRGRLEHEDALAQLGQIIDSRANLPETLRQKFRTVISVLGRSKDALAQFFRRNGE